MHAAAPAALWAAWDECTCAGAALLATFLSELRVLASLSGDWLVSGAYVFTRKRLTGRLCWSMMVTRVARIRGPKLLPLHPGKLASVLLGLYLFDFGFWPWVFNYGARKVLTDLARRRSSFPGMRNLARCALQFKFLI